MIAIQQLSKNFGKFKALDNISVDFNLGDSIALIGPNGSGKTTLIKSILGMVIPDAGQIIINQQNILNQWQYRNQIGYMPQIGRYPDNMKVWQLFDMMKDLRKDHTKGTDEELLESFGLNQILDKKLYSLSGGTRQKVSACLAFLFNPEILIFDEPTAGLDPLASEILKEKIIAEKQKGKLILITSHILNDLDELTTHIVFLQEGKLQFYKDLETLKDETGERKLGKAITKAMSKNGLVNQF